MKKLGSVVVMVLMVAATLFTPNEAFAGCGSHGSCGRPSYGYGYRYNYGGRYSASPFGYGYGRFPLRGFAAPIRRSLGLPGFTPVRQFLFGRGRLRRINRRAFLFGF